MTIHRIVSMLHPPLAAAIPTLDAAEMAMLRALHSLIRPTSEALDWFNRHID